MEAKVIIDLTEDGPPSSLGKHLIEANSEGQEQVKKKRMLENKDVEGDVPDDLECSLCRFPFKEPVQTSCGHIFCKECIHVYFCGFDANPWDQHFMNQATTKLCPFRCTSMAPIFDDGHVQRKVNELIACCSGKFCTFWVKANHLPELKTHEAQCVSRKAWKILDWLHTTVLNNAQTIRYDPILRGLLPIVYALRKQEISSMDSLAEMMISLYKDNDASEQSIESLIQILFSETL
jgi:hypothetical protein